MYRKILVSTDGSELSIRAVKEAARLAASVGARLLVLHVRSPWNFRTTRPAGPCRALARRRS